MGSYEWLLSDTRTSLRLDEPVRFHDSRWAGWMERVELTPALRTYCWNLSLREPLRMSLRTTDAPQWLFFNAASSGGASYQTPEGFRFFYDTRRSLAMRPSLLTIEGAGIGSHSRSFGVGVQIDNLESAVGEELPSALRRLARDHIPVSTATEFASTRAIRALVDSISAGLHRGAWRRFQLEHAALYLLGLIAAELSDRKAPRPQRGATHRERSAANDIRALLEECFADPPSLQELARISGLTPRRLNSVFRMMFGTTVYGVTQSVRLERARQALERENVSIKQLAYRLGYAHPSNFIRAFTRYFGEPPGRFAAGSERQEDSDPPTGENRS